MAKHNWPELRRRFIQGEWLTYEVMGQATGIKPGFIRQRAAMEKWGELRAKTEQELEAKSMERLTTRLAREAEKRIPGWLELADALKYKALQTITEQAFRFTGQEAVRAIGEAVGIEAKLLLPKDQQDGAQEARGPLLAFTQINMTANGPAQLPQPAAFTEANDAQLISLLGKANLDARVVEAKDGDKPGRRSSRAAKKAKRPR